MASPRRVEVINSRITLEVFGTIDGDHNQLIAIEGQNYYFSELIDYSEISHATIAGGWSFHNSFKMEDSNISSKKGEVGKTGMLFFLKNKSVCKVNFWYQCCIHLVMQQHIMKIRILDAKMI